VRLGGRLTSFPALKEHCAWTPPGDERLHVEVAAHARALRDPDTGARFAPRDDVVVHWSGDRVAQGGFEEHAAYVSRVSQADHAALDSRGRHATRGARAARAPNSVPSSRSRAMVPLPRAISHLPAHLDHALLVAVLDSAVRGRLTTVAELATELSAAPRLSQALCRVDTRAESGTESVARIRMQAAGIHPELQVKLGGHRVDFLVAGRLVIEVDGRAFHDDELQFERDRRRDAELTVCGYRVLRFSYAQVLFDWPTCLGAIRAALAQL
jgi:very-short-patch-repair endonuclease